MTIYYFQHSKRCMTDAFLFSASNCILLWLLTSTCLTWGRSGSWVPRWGFGRFTTWWLTWHQGRWITDTVKLVVAWVHGIETCSRDNTLAVKTLACRFLTGIAGGFPERLSTATRSCRISDQVSKFTIEHLQSLRVEIQWNDVAVEGRSAALSTMLLTDFQTEIICFWIRIIACRLAVCSEKIKRRWAVLTAITSLITRLKFETIEGVTAFSATWPSTVCKCVKMWRCEDVAWSSRPTTNDNNINNSNNSY